MSPAEWAEELRQARKEWITSSAKYAYVLFSDDCRELADRMDDLQEALRLLRPITNADKWRDDRDALLAKYAEEETK